MKDYSRATGLLVSLLPADVDAEVRKELVTLLRNGIPFTQQHCGKRPEFLHRYLASLVAKMPEPVSFEVLLQELEHAAERRALQRASHDEPIERVDHTGETVTYHDDRGRRVHVAFKTLRNHLSAARKKMIPDEFPGLP